MLRATVKRQLQQIEDLRRQLGKLRKEIERLKQVCREAGIDPEKASPATAPAAKTPRPPGPRPKTSRYRSVAKLLRAVPKELMPPGKARTAQRAKLDEWAARRLPGSTLTAEITVRLLRRHASGEAQVVGEPPSPPRLHRRQAHCAVYARFSSRDAKQLRNVKEGMRIKVTGVLARGRPGSNGPLCSGSGQIDLELYGHRVGTKERVQGWNERHAFIEIRLEKCRIVK